LFLLCCSETEIWASLFDHISGHTGFVAREVLGELLSQILSLRLVVFGVWPASNGAQDFGIHTEHTLWYLQLEASHFLGLRHIKRVVVNGINDSTGLGQVHALANSVLSSNPAGVDEPHLGVVFLALLGQHLSVLVGMKGEEGLTEASGEGGDGVNDTHLGTSDLGGVARNEVVHGLFGGKSAHGGHNTEGITGQEDHVFGVTTDSRDLNVLDVLEGVTDTGVLGETSVVVVNCTGTVGVGVVLCVLNEGTESDSVENIGFLLSGETVALSVATTFNVENVVVGPDVLIITNQGALRITGQGCLTGTGETEQDGGVTLGSDVGRAMHREGVLLGHVVVHNTEDTFLHLTGVGASKNDLLLGGEVHVDGVLALDIVQGGIRAELTSVEDGEVGAGLEVFVDLLLGCAFEHLLHEKSVVGASRDDSGFELEAFIPTGILVNDEDSLTHVEEVNSSGLVKAKGLRGAGDVNCTPVNSISGLVV